MRVPQIQITQNQAKIGLDISEPKVNINQENAQMEIRQTPAVLNIEKSEAQLYIDPTRAWEALAKWSSLKLGEVITQRRQQMAMEAIAEIAAKGDRLAAIHQNGNPIAQMAEESVYKTEEMYITGEASYDNVALFFEPAKLHIDWMRGSVEISVTPIAPQFQFTRGQVDVYLRQMNSIQFSFPTVEARL